VKNDLSEAISYFESKNYNKALSLFKQILKAESSNEAAMYYTCLVYRALKKWSLCKSLAREYIKKHGRHWKVLEILGDVYEFEGDYRMARSLYKASLKRVGDEKEHQRILSKLQNCEKKTLEAKRKPKVALIVAEGTDNFTDDLLEKLSEHFWIKKVVIQKPALLFYALLCKLVEKKVMKPSLCSVLIRIFPNSLKKAISWAQVIWIEWFSNLALLASYMPRRRGKKLFVRLHRYEAFTEYPLLANWKNIDGVVFVSDFMREILKMRGFDLQKTNTKVIYNGIDISRFKFKQRQKGYNIGLVAHIILRKNLHIAFEIIKKLAEKDARYKLHVAGSFDDLEYEIYLKHLVKTMGIESNVVFHGWIEDIEQWWEDKEYLLSTSIHESFGYNIVEAMAKGIKPIIHNFFDAKELYDDQFLFSSIDEAVENIVNGDYDSSYYREYVMKKGWTLEEQARKFETFIRELMNS